MNKTTEITRRSLSLGMASALCSTAMPVWAQTAWPTKPIRIIGPSAAGGAADFVARTFANYVQPLIGQPVVVENKPGAGSIIGAQYVKDAKPDGYTFLLSGTSTNVANPFLFASLPYDPVKDFVEVGMFGTYPMVGLVKPGSPLKSVSDIIAQSKAGKVLSYGYYSATSQIPPELIKARTGISVLPVRYKNITQIIVDIAGGVIDYAFLDEMSAISSIGSMVAAIAVTSPERDANLPGVGAVAEVLPGFDMQTWSGLTAPAGTPAAILSRMSDYIRQVVSDPGVRATMGKHGMTVQYKTPKDAAAFMVEDRKRWSDFVRIANIQPE
jgi:tripartite-type tricarboxylate transporter receptor subunit TctC